MSMSCMAKKITRKIYKMTRISRLKLLTLVYLKLKRTPATRATKLLFKHKLRLLLKLKESCKWIFGIQELMSL